MKRARISDDFVGQFVMQHRFLAFSLMSLLEASSKVCDLGIMDKTTCKEGSRIEGIQKMCDVQSDIKQ